MNNYLTLINSVGDDITQSSFLGVFLIPLGEINIQIKAQQPKERSNF